MFSRSLHDESLLARLPFNELKHVNKHIFKAGPFNSMYNKQQKISIFSSYFFSGFSVHFWIKRKPSNAYSLHCSCGVSNSAMSCKLVLLLGRDYYCKFKEVKANERFKRLKRNTFLYNGFFWGSLSSLLHSSN